MQASRQGEERISPIDSDIFKFNFAAATHVHKGVSLFNLLQLLQLWTPHHVFSKVTKICTLLHQLPGSDDARKMPLTGWELGVPLLLRNLAGVLGPTQLIAALEALEGPYSSQYRILSESFGVCLLVGHKTAVESKCKECGSILYLRCACLACGQALHCKDLQLIPAPVPSCIQRENLRCFQEQNLRCSTQQQMSTPVVRDLDLLENARKERILAGVSYLARCGSDEATFDKFGGDIIFLFRNLVHSAGGSAIQSHNFDMEDSTEVSTHIAGHLHSLIRHWMAQHIRISTEMELERILNMVEALHVLTQLGISDSDSLPSLQQMMETLTSFAHPIVSTHIALTQSQRLIT